MFEVLNSPPEGGSCPRAFHDLDDVDDLDY